MAHGLLKLAVALTFSFLIITFSLHSLIHALMAMNAVKHRNIRHRGAGQKMVNAQQVKAAPVVKNARCQGFASRQNL